MTPQTETTVGGITPIHRVHEIGVKYATDKLAKNGIPTHQGGGYGIDLILDDNKTVLVRAKSTESRAALIRRSLDDLKTDYLIIVTNLESPTPGFYIIKMDDVKNIAIDQPDKSGESDYVIYYKDYYQYKDNYSIIIDGYNTITKVRDIKPKPMSVKELKVIKSEYRKLGRPQRQRDAMDRFLNGEWNKGY